MQHVPNALWADVARWHREELNEFILPRCVLDGMQGGDVVSGTHGPRKWALVINRVGFTQVVGAIDPEELAEGLLEPNGPLAGRYLLWYDAPGTIVKILQQKRLKGFQERPRIRYAPWSGQRTLLSAMVGNMHPDLRVTPLTAELLPACDPFELKLSTRFWNSVQDLLQHAGGMVVLEEEQPVAICYAAGVADGQAELDVMTVPDHRGKGAGKLACAAFILGMEERGVRVVWDAFTTNIASVRTAQALGFKEGKHYSLTSFQIDTA
jgi:RimJ/RimL family protein N-acetyltransferase